MKRTVELIGMSIFATLLISFAIWWEMSIWQECRAFGHSWFYCFNMLGSK